MQWTGCRAVTDSHLDSGACVDCASPDRSFARHFGNEIDRAVGLGICTTPKLLMIDEPNFLTKYSLLPDLLRPFPPPCSPGHLGSKRLWCRDVCVSSDTALRNGLVMYSRGKIC